MTKAPRPHPSADQRRAIVALFASSTMSYAALAGHLGYAPATIRNWVRQALDGEMFIGDDILAQLETRTDRKAVRRGHMSEASVPTFRSRRAISQDAAAPALPAHTVMIETNAIRVFASTATDPAHLAEWIQALDRALAKSSIPHMPVSQPVRETQDS